MRSRSAVILTLGILAVVGTSVMAQPGRPQRGGPQEAARYGWLSSFADGKAEARRTGKPLMVVLRCFP
jgi:hypothetical protein